MLNYLHTASLPFAVAMTVLFAFFGIRLVAGVASKAPKKVLMRRVLAAVLTVALAGSSVAGYFGTALKSETPDTADPGPLVASAAGTEEKDEPMAAVNLTKMQIDAILSEYSLLFDNGSLASMAQERLEAIKKYGVEFNGAVYMPLAKVLGRLSDIQNGKISADDLDALYKEARHDLNQLLIADPVALDMFLQMLSLIPEATENNPWIETSMTELDGYFAKTSDPQGLDCLLEYAGKDIMVTRHVAEIAAHVIALLDQMSIKGVTTRTSIHNWEIPLIAEDSRTRTQESTTQESRPALLFTYVNKGGKEVIAIGVNLYDQRAEIFPTNVKEEPAKQKETPPQDQPQDKPEDKPQDIPTQPEVKSYNLTIKYLETGTENVMFPQYGPTKYKQGSSYSIDSPQKEGYTCSLPVVAGTMGSQNQTITVWYTPIPQETSKHILQVQYLLEDGTPAPGIDWISEVRETGSKYSYDTPKLKGYTPDRANVSGTMPDHDVVEKVVYKLNSWELLIHYVDKDTGKTLAKDYKSTYKYQQWYEVKSPGVEGYVCEEPIVAGQMPDHDVEKTVYYTKINTDHTLTIYYQFITGGRAAPTYIGTYAKGARYSVRSPEVAGWTPVTSVVEGTMGDEDLVFTVYYSQDGAGKKDPNADPGPQGNAPEKGGENDTSQGEGGATGVDQGTKPPDHDYGNGDMSTGQDRDDLDENGNSTIPNVPGQGDDESSGTGGVDHPQEDGEGGNTENGDMPDKDPIPEHNDNDGSGDWSDEEIGEPPV